MPTKFIALTVICQSFMCVQVASLKGCRDQCSFCANADEFKCTLPRFIRSCQLACGTCDRTTSTKVTTLASTSINPTTTTPATASSTFTTGTTEMTTSTTSTTGTISSTTPTTITTTTTTLTSPPIPVCTWSSSALSFHEICEQGHNYYRCLHGSPNVATDESLQATAQDWADQLLLLGASQQSNTRQLTVVSAMPLYAAGIGENLYWLNDPSRTATADDAIIAWYSQYFIYDFENPAVDSTTDEFTQMMWRSNMRIGCGIASEGSNTYIVAHYSPGGNIPELTVLSMNVGPVLAEICEANCGSQSYCQGLSRDLSVCTDCVQGFSRCTSRCTQYCPKPAGFASFWREWCQGAILCTCDSTSNLFASPPVYPGAKCD